jgi:phosphoglycerate dehydrogenase-like enzyme
VLVVDPLVGPEAVRAAGAEPAGLEELLRESDFVTLHVPVTEQTRGLIGRVQLAMMKPAAILINTARGELVDQMALVEALRAGRLHGAGLDAYAQEPPDPAQFEGLPAVVLTPHMASHTEEALINMGRGAVENLLAVLEGRRPPNPVVLPEGKAR